jgi:radical SAM superfamily enzyme YgiQ (UPF0313 family)
LKKIALITIYNPGAAGMRYIAGSIKAAGHEVHLISFKELRTSAIPTSEKELHRKLKKNRDVLYIIWPLPGRLIYSPFPTPITEREKEILVERLEEIKPDLIGFSFFSVTFDTVSNLTSHIRKKIPDTPIIFGGLHAIVAPHECIEHADIVCTGEGEEVIRELLERWDEYKKKGSIDTSGLWFRDKNGNVIKNPERPVIKDLDSIPFPIYGENETLIDDDAILDKMKPGPYLNAHVYTFTERGCPYHCTYCIHSMWKENGFKIFRRRSVDNIMEEVKDLVHRLGMRHIIFHDEIFIINKKWIREFSEKFRKQFHEPYGIKFTGYVHPLTTDEEMLKMMVDAGLSRVGMGVQSGSERINKEIFKRNHRPEESIKMAKMLQEYDFEIIQYDLLVNNPFETDEDRKHTFDLLLEFPPPFYPGLFGLVIYKYSKLSSMTPPSESYDEKSCQFWNMMYHLTGFCSISKENKIEISKNPYYRENPEALEQLVIDLEKNEKELIKARSQIKTQEKEICSMKEWIKNHEAENYPFKEKVKSKIKKIFYPLIKG